MSTLAPTPSLRPHTFVSVGNGIRPYSWQAYGYYADAPGRPVFAAAARASNPFTARAAITARLWDAAPVITYLERV
jgi:hypothetical protein